MKQSLVIPDSTHTQIDAISLVAGAVGAIVTSEVFIRKVFDLNKPVMIVNNKLRVNEKLLADNMVYSIMHKNQEYFVRKHKGATEIFQIE
jgi:hypothetical protein